MGNKTREERIKSHALFEQRQEIKRKNKPEELSDDHVRLAALFAIAQPDETAKHCELPLKVLTNIAQSRFAATPPQKREIAKAVAAMGWVPPEA